VQLASWHLQVKIRGKDIDVHLKRTKDGSFQSTVKVDDDVETMTISDNFSLVIRYFLMKLLFLMHLIDGFQSDSVIESNIDGKPSSVVQLIARFPDGSLRMRYKGTALNVPVLPQVDS
jgi:hypothetical protein